MTIDAVFNVVKKKLTTLVGLDEDSLVYFLINAYGDIYNVLNVIEKIESSFSDLNANKYVKLTKKLLPLGLFGFDFYDKVKRYYDSKVDEADEEHYYEKQSKLLNCECEQVYEQDSGYFRLNDDIINWLVSSPRIKLFKIIGIYKEVVEDDCDDFFIKLTDIGSERRINILFECEEVKYLYTLNVVDIKGNKSYHQGGIYANNDEEESITRDRLFIDFKDLIFKEYIKSLNFNENVLMYDNDVRVRPRITDVNFDIYSIDFDELVKEIEYTLDHDYRRGYIFVGNPGTGKTSILLKIENIMRNYPILYITPDNLASEEKMRNVFSFIRTIQPCIVNFEDFDSYGLGDRTNALGVLLGHIDNSKDKLNVVYMATVNDSKKLNYSLVRPGRFDRVVPIKEPSCNNEIYNVMKNYYERQIINNDDIKNSKFINKNNINLLTYHRLKRYNITQAGYCEIVQYMILTKKEFTNKNIIESRDVLLSSKKALKDYERKD